MINHNLTLPSVLWRC